MKNIRDRLDLILWILFGCLVGSFLGLAISADCNRQKTKVRELTVGRLYLHDQWNTIEEGINPFEADTVKLLDVQNGYALFEYTKEEVEYGEYFDTVYTWKQKSSCRVNDFAKQSIKIK